jgi:hypothetical protein
MGLKLPSDPLRKNRTMKNIIPFPLPNDKPTSPDKHCFEELTARLVLARLQAGTLSREVVEALLAGVGLHA